MKKYYILVTLLLLIFSVISNAQVNYSFSATTSTYVPITGGTTPTLIKRPDSPSQSSATFDEGFANNIPIGFTFNYNGVDYTTLNICANGFVTLGDPFFSDNLTIVENFYINSLRLGPIQYASSTDTSLEFGNIKPILAPLWDDLRALSDADLRYVTTGSAGSRIFTFEWANEKWQWDGASPALSFELKLYEGTNVIEFCYKDEGGVPTAAASASIGITASTQIGGGVMSLENTSASPTVSDIETNTIYNKPANNQVYRFTPLLCPLPSNVRYSSYNNTTVNFAWDAPAGVSTFEYAVTTSPYAPASGISTNSTSATVSTLSPDTKYYLHVRSYCLASSQSAWTVLPSFITTKNTSPPPAIAWQKSLGGSAAEGFYDNDFSIKQTSDGGYILAGSTESNDGDVTGNHGGSDGWIVKLGSGGNIEWQKSIGGSGNDYMSSIEQTSDGGYIAAGYALSNDGDVSGNHDATGATGDCWIVKLNNAGGIEWQKSFGGTMDDAAFSVKQTADGGYVFAGVTYSNDGDVSGNHNDNSDMWIVKLNSAGTLQWQKSLGGAGYYGAGEEYAFSIDQTADGGYVAAGYTSSNNGDVVGHHGDYDYWIVKLDGTGTLQWQKCLGGTDTDKASSLAQTSDGGFIVTGISRSLDGDLSPYDIGGYYWVVKLNSTGVLQWQKKFGNGNVSASSIKQTSDGGYIAAGSAYGDGGDVNGNHSLDNSDYWIVKLTSDGSFQWQKCLGGSITEVGHCIETTTDGGYIIAGLSYSTDGDVTSNHGDADIWVVKLEPDAALPVTLLDFSGKTQGKQNLLHWTTATEINNTGYEVRRSSDGTNFNKIGFVNTKAVSGNSNNKISYDFTDAEYSGNTNYYRLKQIDKDGKFSYSNIVVLRNDNYLSSRVSIYPSPAKNVLSVRIASQVNKKITLSIADLSGRLLKNKIANVGIGETIITIDVSQLPSGTYLLKILSGDGKDTSVKKFTKE